MIMKFQTMMVLIMWKKVSSISQSTSICNINNKYQTSVTTISTKTISILLKSSLNLVKSISRKSFNMAPTKLMVVNNKSISIHNNKVCHSWNGLTYQYRPTNQEWRSQTTSSEALTLMMITHKYLRDARRHFESSSSPLFKTLFHFLTFHEMTTWVWSS